MHSCTADTRYTDVERISRSHAADASTWMPCGGMLGSRFRPTFPFAVTRFVPTGTAIIVNGAGATLSVSHTLPISASADAIFITIMCTAASKQASILLACLLACLLAQLYRMQQKKFRLEHRGPRGPLAGVLLSRVHDVRIRYFAAANRDGQKGAWICNGQGERIDHCLGLPRGGHAFSREEQGDGGHVNCLHLPHGRRTYQTHPGF